MRDDISKYYEASRGFSATDEFTNFWFIILVYYKKKCVTIGAET